VSEDLTTEDLLINDIADFQHDPLGYVNFAFPWGETGDLKKNTIRKWQRKFLESLGEQLRNGNINNYEAIQMAVGSGHGCGKSCLVSWLIMWGLSTFEDTKIIVTANTEGQLKTKTWAELAKWHRLAINSHWFEFTATAIYSKDKKHEKTWRADMMPWSEHKTEAFAGLHNEGKRILIIFDESAGIIDKIWEVIEGALTDENTEIIWACFGNITRGSGRFRECFRRLRHRWTNWQIDSREVEGTNKDQIKKWAVDYGEDSDFFKVRVRGMAPSMSSKQFISTEDVDAAFAREIEEKSYSFAPKILTCDPAWDGDDELVIGLRQGLKFQVLKTMPKNDDDVYVAGVLAEFEDEHEADAVFIDLGYGTGIFSAGKALNRRWVLVAFGGKSTDPGCALKRDQMWNDTRKWLREGGCIPKDQILYDELVTVEKKARLDGKIKLESKENMKKRGLPSPNRGDALALSFALPVTKKHRKTAAPSNYSNGDRSLGWMG